MKKISLVLLTIFLLSLFTTSFVSAQTYSFSVDSATIDAYWNADGTLNLNYVYGFTNDPSASPIDFVDIGLPNGNFSLSDVSADVDGKVITDINTADPQYLNGTKDGVTLGLGSNAIQPGQFGVVTLRVNNIRKVMYVYSNDQDKNYASVRLIPNYFGSQYVNGATNLKVTFHLPAGIQPEEPRWEKMASGWPGNAEPETGFDTENRITYTWQSTGASSSDKYEFAAAFPASYIPTQEVYTPPAFTFDPTILICPCMSIFFLAIIGYSFYSAIWGSKKRKLQYLPPKISIEGHGIKRGLTAVQAAIIMEQPMDKLLTMILFGVIKKSAASVKSREPLDVVVTEPLPAGLQPYELEFLNAFKSPAGKERQAAMQEVVVNLVKSVTELMKGFSRKETVAYYEDINKKAWEQVEASGTPEVKSQKYDENLEWTMLDKNYNDRTQKTFSQGPVFLPMWWGNFDPTFRGSSVSHTPISTGSTPSFGSSKPISVTLPSLPGADFASSMTTGIQTFAAGAVGNITNFTSGITNRTNPPPPPSTSSSRGGGSSGHSCACACACAGCACACAGGGR
jgi:hypothetical protein